MSVLADSRLRVALPVAFAVLVTDQLSKWVVASSMRLHETIDLLPIAALTYERNTGAAFSMLAAAPAAVRFWLFIGVTVVAIGVLISYVRSAPPGAHALVAALGAILGGALGNLICRIRFGEVVDFMDLHWGTLHWPVFNVADSAITIGVVVVLLTSLRSDPVPTETGPV